MVKREAAPLYMIPPGFAVSRTNPLYHDNWVLRPPPPPLDANDDRRDSYNLLNHLNRSIVNRLQIYEPAPVDNLAEPPVKPPRSWLRDKDRNTVAARLRTEFKNYVSSKIGGKAPPPLPARDYPAKDPSLLSAPRKATPPPLPARNDEEVEEAPPTEVKQPIDVPTTRVSHFHVSSENNIVSRLGEPKPKKKAQLKHDNLSVLSSPSPADPSNPSEKSQRVNRGVETEVKVLPGELVPKYEAKASSTKWLPLEAGRHPHRRHHMGPWHELGGQESPASSLSLTYPHLNSPPRWRAPICMYAPRTMPYCSRCHWARPVHPYARGIRHQTRAETHRHQRNAFEPRSSAAAAASRRRRKLKKRRSYYRDTLYILIFIIIMIGLTGACAIFVVNYIRKQRASAAS